MNTKTIFKCATVLMCAAASVNANAQAPVTARQQGTPQKSALEIVIDNAIELKFDASINSVGFRLTTPDDYRNQKESPYTDLFEVLSNIPYNVSVKTGEAEMSNQNDPAQAKKLPVSAISMALTNTTSAHGTVATTAVPLDDADQYLTQKAPETLSTKFSLKVMKTTGSFDKFLVPGGLYKTDLFITAAQD